MLFETNYFYPTSSLPSTSELFTLDLVIELLDLAEASSCSKLPNIAEF